MDYSNIAHITLIVPYSRFIMDHKFLRQEYDLNWFAFLHNLHPFVLEGWVTKLYIRALQLKPSCGH